MPDNSDIELILGSCLIFSAARSFHSDTQNESSVAEFKALFKLVNVHIILLDVARINPTQHPTGTLEVLLVSQEHGTGEHRQWEEASHPALRNISSVGAVFIGC